MMDLRISDRSLDLCCGEGIRAPGMSGPDEENEMRRAQAVRNVDVALVSVVFRLPGVTHDASRITFDWFA